MSSYWRRNALQYSVNFAVSPSAEASREFVNIALGTTCFFYFSPERDPSSANFAVSPSAEASLELVHTHSAGYYISVRILAYICVLILCNICVLTLRASSCTYERVRAHIIRPHTSSTHSRQALSQASVKPRTLGWRVTCLPGSHSKQHAQTTFYEKKKRESVMPRTLCRRRLPTSLSL